MYDVIRDFLFFVGGFQLCSSYLFDIEDNGAGRNSVNCSYKLGLSRSHVLGYMSRLVFYLIKRSYSAVVLIDNALRYYSDIAPRKMW